ncbi:MAG: ParB N-terminal domain-containing protein, partial [Clostridia bacterium]
MIRNISIENLYPHPQNPRKDLGDLTELAQSIKAQGVLQNLTVVPFTPGKGHCPSCTQYAPMAPNLCKEDRNDRAPCQHWEDAGRYCVLIG